MRALAAALCLLLAACSQPAAPPPQPDPARSAPADSQHAGITEPHGDHSPHHGGLVLMSGDVHYEVVLDPSGHYEVWFSDAIRTELPASVASNVRVAVARPGEPVETLPLAIDESGESWTGTGQPLTGDGIMVKVTYDLRGVPQEIEIPFVPATKP